MNPHDGRVVGVVFSLQVNTEAGGWQHSQQVAGLELNLGPRVGCGGQ